MKTLKAKYLNPKLNDVSSHPVISRKAHREKSQIPKLLIKSIQFVLESVLLKAEKPNAKRSFDISDVFSGVWSGQVGALWGVFALRKSRSSITPWSQPDSEHDCKHFRKAEKEKK